MKDSCLIPILAALLAAMSGCATGPPDVSTPEPPERWHFQFDSRDWRLGRHGATAGIIERQYFPAGENKDQWTEAVTSHYIRGDLAPYDYYQTMMISLRDNCPSFKSSVIEHSENEILFEWRHEGCRGLGPRHEIRRITRGGNGTLSLAYVMKAPDMTPSRRIVWITILKAAISDPAA